MALSGLSNSFQTNILVGDSVVGVLRERLLASLRSEREGTLQEFSKEREIE